jgi:3-oxoacyl-[acyl-carrier protein] reductase
MTTNQNGILAGKTAIIFGAGGAIGSSVAKTFAREGATLFLAGRHIDAVAKTMEQVKSSGYHATSDKVNAIDEAQVNTYFEKVFKQSEKIDIVFNAIGSRMDGAIHVMPSTETSLETFTMYLNNMVLSQFLTARVAAKYMAKQNKGSIVLMAATPSRGVAPFLPGACAGHAAIDGLARCLALEFGAMGVRVNAVMSGGMQETPNIQEVLKGMAKLVGAPIEALMQQVKEKSILKRTSTLEETAEVVTFIASDKASSITGAIINASCGEVLD